MNIVETILTTKKRYIILISGYLWWDYLNTIIYALSENLNFKVIFLEQLLANNSLITFIDQLNFLSINDEMKQLNQTGGYIIVSYTFPIDKLQFYADYHINITMNPSLLTEVGINMIKDKNIKRSHFDEHIIFLSKSWTTNKINKKIVYPSNYNNGTTAEYLYEQIFNSIMDNIKRKLYGDTYDAVVATELKSKQLSTISDPNIITAKTQGVINNGIAIGSFETALDTIIDKPTSNTELTLPISSNNQIKLNDMTFETITQTGGTIKKFYLIKN